MKFILMWLLRQFRKNYGREPSFDELRTLGNQAKEIEKLDRGQVIPFPETRITDPFTPRPEPFNKLIDPKSDTGIKLGKVREGLKKRETEAQMLARMKRQNKEAAQRLRDKKKPREDK